MDALLRSRRLLVREYPSTLRQQIARQGVLLLFALVLGAALMLGIRRATGALERPLAASALLAVAMSLAAATVLLRYAARQYFSPRARLAMHVVATFSLLVIGWSVSLPHSSAGGLFSFWIVLIAGGMAAWVPWNAPLMRLRTRELVKPQAIAGSPIERFKPTTPALTPDDTFPAGLLQQITRTRADDGTEMISGWVGVVLAAGQRSATAHVAFCPPFARVPQIEVFDDGGEARIKLAQVLPHGARFDVKLTAPAEEPFVQPVRFSATCGV